MEEHLNAAVVKQQAFKNLAQTIENFLLMYGNDHTTIIGDANGVRVLENTLMSKEDLY